MQVQHVGSMSSGFVRGAAAAARQKRCSGLAVEAQRLSSRRRQPTDGSPSFFILAQSDATNGWYALATCATLSMSTLTSQS